MRKFYWRYFKWWGKNTTINPQIKNIEVVVDASGGWYKKLEK